MEVRCRRNPHKALAALGVEDASAPLGAEELPAPLDAEGDVPILDEASAFPGALASIARAKTTRASAKSSKQ